MVQRQKPTVPTYLETAHLWAQKHTSWYLQRSEHGKLYQITSTDITADLAMQRCRISGILWHHPMTSLSDCWMQSSSLESTVPWRLELAACAELPFGSHDGYLECSTDDSLFDENKDFVETWELVRACKWQVISCVSGLTIIEKLAEARLHAREGTAQVCISRTFAPWQRNWRGYTV